MLLAACNVERKRNQHISDTVINHLFQHLDIKGPHFINLGPSKLLFFVVTCDRTYTGSD